MKQKTILILRLPASGPAGIATIPNTLEAMQHEVGGLIEPVNLARECVDAFMNEEALLEELPVNPHMTAVYRHVNPKATDIGNRGFGYRGDAFVSRLDPETGDQIDLTDEDILWLQQQIQQ